MSIAISLNESLAKHRGVFDQDPACTASYVIHGFPPYLVFVSVIHFLYFLFVSYILILSLIAVPLIIFL